MATEAAGLLLSPLHPRVPLRKRLLGLGSVFGKTLLDSRASLLVIAALLASIIVVGGATMASTYGTPEARFELATLSRTMPPIIRGLYGNPVNVDTLGGFVSWHYGTYFALLVGLWSILALSSTLAGEARRGCLDFAVATGRSRASIALEKVAGHLAALAVTMTIVAIATWATGVAFARLDGDAIAPASAIGFAVGLGLRGLIAGSIAFALAPLFGRAAAAGIAGAVMVAGYVVYSYRTVVPAFDALAQATWFSWSEGHIPIAGQFDWPALAFVALVCVILIGLGVAAFARRDVGVTISLPTLRLPKAILGVRGPVTRSFGDLLPPALAWGTGLGLYGLVMAASSRSVADALASAPGIADTVRTLIPGLDLTTAAGMLQLAFVDLGFVMVGVAVATFVAARSSDETAGRLELQLSTPLSRVHWAVASGAAVWLAIALVAVLLGASIALGVASVGDDPVQPMLGTLVLALYGVALGGIGMAVSGLLGASLAAPTVLVVAIGTFLIDLLAPALRLPDWIAQLALTTHLGEPMVGVWDAPGVAACIALAIGGLALGAWGMSRRDVSA